MVIKLRFEVEVDINDTEIKNFREKFPQLSQRGFHSIDTNIAYALSYDKAVAKITRHDREVKIRTSLDEYMPEKK